MIDTGIDHDMIARTRAADWRDARAILVTERQMKKDILDSENTELLQFLGATRTDSLQHGDGHRIEHPP
jgi:hypothetical protein